MGIPSTSPSTYFIRASSRSWLVRGWCAYRVEGDRKLWATPVASRRSLPRIDGRPRDGAGVFAVFPSRCELMNSSSTGAPCAPPS